MDSEQILLFDSRMTFPVRTVVDDGRIASVAVAFPDDKQIVRRQKARKIIVSDLGRRKSETKIFKNGDVDLQILSEIKRDGPQCDDNGATHILDQLIDTEVVDIQHEGGGYRVFLRVPAVLVPPRRPTDDQPPPSVTTTTVTEHVLNCPSMREVMDQREFGTRLIMLPYGKRDVKMNMEFYAELYDKHRQDGEGYAEGSSIPLCHKAATMKEVFEALERELRGESEATENFR